MDDITAAEAYRQDVSLQTLSVPASSPPGAGLAMVEAPKRSLSPPDALPQVRTRAISDPRR
jgi:hypothetical protein